MALTSLVKNYVDIAIGVTVLIAAFGVFYRKIVHPMHNLLVAQLTPQDGESLVDKVNRISVNHEEAQKDHIEAQGHWTALELSAQDTTTELKALASQLHSNNERFDKVEASLQTLHAGQKAVERRLTKVEMSMPKESA
jgi:septal ring factor EnvC (AmiA/AmiB activator)